MSEAPAITLQASFILYSGSFKKLPKVDLKKSPFYIFVPESALNLLVSTSNLRKLMMSSSGLILHKIKIIDNARLVVRL